MEEVMIPQVPNEKIEKKSEVIGDIIVDSVKSELLPITEAKTPEIISPQEEIKDNVDSKIAVESKDTVKENIVYES
jgi:thiamine pyrophosphokinase